MDSHEVRYQFPDRPLHGRRQFDILTPHEGVTSVELVEIRKGNAKALCDAKIPGHRIPHELSRAAMRPLLRNVFGPFAGDGSEN